MTVGPLTIWSNYRPKMTDYPSVFALLSSSSLYSFTKQKKLAKFLPTKNETINHRTSILKYLANDSNHSNASAFGNLHLVALNDPVILQTQTNSIMGSTLGKNEPENYMDIDLLISHPGYSDVAKSILTNLDFKTLLHCRVVSKSWKDFIDFSPSSKYILFLQFQHLLNVPNVIRITSDLNMYSNTHHITKEIRRELKNKQINSILQQWPTYHQLLEFIRNEATMEEIHVILDFFKQYCGTKKYLGYLKECDQATPFYHALKLRNSTTKKMLISIFMKAMFENNEQNVSEAYRRLLQ